MFEVNLNLLGELPMNTRFERNGFQGGLTVISIGSDHDLQPGARYGPVIRNIYIIECCTGGFGSIIINGRTFPIKAGDCYVMLPGDAIIQTADEVMPRRGYWCVADGARIGHYLAMAGISSDAPFAPPEAFDAIAGQLELLYQMREENDPGADLRRSACMYTIFGELLRGKTAAMDRGHIVRKAVSIMEARYNQPLTVEQIAGDVGLDRCYFSTLFKAETGTSPHCYLTGLRLEKACMLMEHEECTVAEAAISVGLDPENFARLFRRYMGVTPGEYRKKAVTEKLIDG